MHDVPHRGQETQLHQ